MLAIRLNPKLEDHALSAVRDCFFNLFAASLHIGVRSSIGNLRTRHALMTGTHKHGNPGAFMTYSRVPLICIFLILHTQQNFLHIYMTRLLFCYRIIFNLNTPTRLAVTLLVPTPHFYVNLLLFLHRQIFCLVCCKATGDNRIIFENNAMNF